MILKWWDRFSKMSTVPVCCLLKVDSDTDPICLFSLRGDFDLVPLGSDSLCFTSLAEAIAQIPQSKKSLLEGRDRWTLTPCPHLAWCIHSTLSLSRKGWRVILAFGCKASACYSTLFFLSCFGSKWYFKTYFLKLVYTKKTFAYSFIHSFIIS